VSLLHLSLYKQLKLMDLAPTDLPIQLVDCSIRWPVGILEDVLVQVGKLLIPCNFMVLDLEDILQVPIIWGDHSSP